MRHSLPMVCGGEGGMLQNGCCHHSPWLAALLSFYCLLVRCICFMLPGTSFLRCAGPRSTLVGDVAEVKAIKKAFHNTSHIKVGIWDSGRCLNALP